MADKQEWWPRIVECPERMSFVPGTERDDFTLTTREASVADYDLVRRLSRLAGIAPSKAKLLQWITQHGHVVRLTLRSQRYLVGGTISTHWPDKELNRVHAFWVHPDYSETKAPLTLLQLARLELPEYATSVSVSPGDTCAKTVLASAGWTEISDYVEGSTRFEYRIRSVAGREHRALVEKSSVLR